MNNISKKTLVIGIILLMFAVSFNSAISVENKPSILGDENEECKECEELCNAELVKVKQLVNRVEVYIKLLLALYKDNPELTEKCEELFNLILILDNYDLKEIICDLLINLVYYFYDKYQYFGYDVLSNIPKDEIFKIYLIVIIALTYHRLAFKTIAIVEDLKCDIPQ